MHFLMLKNKESSHIKAGTNNKSFRKWTKFFHFALDKATVGFCMPGKKMGSRMQVHHQVTELQDLTYQALPKGLSAHCCSKRKAGLLLNWIPCP